MKSALLIAFSLAISLFSTAAPAQVPVTPNPNHEQLLQSADPKAAANKRLVYDFWREVFEGGQLGLAEKYLAEDYIQHNPTVPTGRAGFVEFFRRFAKEKPIQARVQAPLVSIVAKGDLVVLAFVTTAPDPKDPAKTYTTTWFDMFQIANGKIAEHWDPTTKR
ncbi:MAG: nuclear transport factor 2 family protein [Verrucomicrobia bacterium]|nr:nuclear transport factor 2 family protein [Verrucomicrobiota bacterium]